MNAVQIWVDPLFKQRLKKEAIDSNLPLTEFTRRICTGPEPIGEMINRKEVKARGLPRL